MNPSLVGLIVFACVFGAALLAMRLRAALPEHHLSGDTKDTVKLTMGLVATMSALVLGPGTLEGTDVDDIKSATEKLQTASYKLAEIVYQGESDAEAGEGETSDSDSSSDEEEVVDAEVVEEDK